MKRLSEIKRRAGPGLLALVLLGACQSAVPDSGAGVGFSDYNAYESDRQARELALRRGTTMPQTPRAGTAQSGNPGATAPTRPVISGDDLRAAGLPAADGGPITPSAPLSATSLDGGGTPAPVDPNNPRISDEQNFDAVSSRETIESDAERLARQRAAYEVVQPKALPTRDGGSRPNIVSFALSTTNLKGQRLYSRSGFNADAKFQRACAAYPSSDRAQEDFLRDGGPQKDKSGVDPDGDGFACYWDPAPFRAVRGN